MHIKLNQILCVIPHEDESLLLSLFSDFILKKYYEMDVPIRSGLKLLTRKILYEEEKKARKAGNVEYASMLRPEKRADPNIHLMHLIIRGITGLLDNVILTIGYTTNSGTTVISDFGFQFQNQGETGGQMAGDGYDRIGKDHLLENVGGAFNDLVSKYAPLRSG